LDVIEVDEIQEEPLHSLTLQIVHYGHCCGSVSVLIPIPHLFPDEEKLLGGPMLSAI
jgi:hypothetical protein